MEFITNAINNILQTPTTITTTENGAIAFTTTQSQCLDFFFKLIRKTSKEDVCKLFYDAWLDDPLSAVKILLHCRDCRGGKGERLIVYYCLTWLRRHKPITYLRNLPTFLNVGYYQDLLNMVKEAEQDEQPTMGTHDMIELELFADQLRKDETNLTNKSGPISLAAKWAPTECHADDREYEFASRLAKLLFPDVKKHHALKAYRQMLTKLRNHLKIVESQMAHNQWSEIEYSTVPAKSHHLHTSAFKKHDPERYNQYLLDLKSNIVTIKSTGLQPHELTKPFMSLKFPENSKTLQAQWDDMIQKLSETGKLDNVLPLCDVSSSMNGEPLDVCIALGLMVSELVTGPFKNMVMTFETNPKLIKIKGTKLGDRVRELKHASWNGSTNLSAAFDQILNHALLMNCTQEQLPKVLIIFSDMQFDQACPDTNRNPTVYELAKEKFEAEGYKLPSVIFWNLRDTKKSFPITMNENGVALLSGYSGQLLKSIMEDIENITPMKMLHQILYKYPDVVVESSEVGPIQPLDENRQIYIYDHSKDKNKRRNKRGKGPGSVRRKDKNKTEDVDVKSSNDLDPDHSDYMDKTTDKKNSIRSVTAPIHGGRGSIGRTISGRGIHNVK